MQMLSYLQEVVQNIKEVKVIAETVDNENAIMRVSTEDLYNNQFLDTCTIDGIKKYESMLGIDYLATDTLQDRIFRVIAYYNKQLPYTRPMLEQNLEAFCGKDGYKIIYNFSENKLTVKIALSAKSMFNTVKSYLESTVPLNLIIDCLLLYNTWSVVSSITWNQAATMTWKQIREEDITNVNNND